MRGFGVVLKLKALLANSFVRNVSVLAGGTAVAQGIALLGLPLLTRLYSPEEFGTLGVFVAMLGMISVMAGLRYEIAIPLPESDKSAANLLAVALLCSTVVSVLVTAVTLLFAGPISHLVNSPALAKMWWLLPLGVSVTSAYAALQFWATRKKAFRRIAATRIQQAVGGLSTQALLGWMGVGAWGLVLGQVVNAGAGFLGLAWRAAKEDRESLRSLSWGEMRSAASDYQRFPKYSAVEALANMAAVQLPLILIAGLVAGEEVGYLMLGMRVMQAPVGLIGSSINQVYFPRAVEQHRQGQLAGLTIGAVASLAKIGAGPLLWAGIVAPALFPMIFGPQWLRAGELVAWMTPWFVFQFLSQPVSMAIHVTSNQKLGLMIQLLGLLLRTGSVLALMELSAGELVSEGYAISGFIFYFFYLLTILSISGVSIAHGIRLLAGAGPFVLFWLAFGIVIRVLI